MTTDAPPLPAQLAAEIDRALEGFSGTVAMWFHDVTRGETHGIRPDELFPPASMIKLFVLREVFRQAGLRRISLDDPIVLTGDDAVPGTGVLKDLRPGVRLSVADAATLMITVSDNVATNLLIDRLGTGAINGAARRAGYLSTRLGGKLNSGRRAGSTTTAREMGRCMLEIVRGGATGEPAALTMLDILRREQCSEIVGRDLPAAVSATGVPWGSWRVASKSGTLAGVRNDVAYVEGGPVRYVVALLSRDCTDPRFSVDNEANLCLARIARLVHDHASRPQDGG